MFSRRRHRHTAHASVIFLGALPRLLTGRNGKEISDGKYRYY